MVPFTHGILNNALLFVAGFDGYSLVLVIVVALIQFVVFFFFLATTKT
jgi:hypothetical protein